MKKELETKWKDVCNELRDNGYSIVGVVSEYSKDSVNFMTHIGVNEKPEIQLTEDHIVLDAIREISNEWSEVVHSQQNNK